MRCTKVVIICSYTRFVLVGAWGIRRTPCVSEFILCLLHCEPASTSCSQAVLLFFFAVKYNETVIPRRTWPIRLRRGCNGHDGGRCLSVFAKTLLLRERVLTFGKRPRYTSIYLCCVTCHNFIQPVYLESTKKHAIFP